MSEGSPLLRENEGDQSLSNYPVETVTETVSVTVVSQPGEPAAKDYDHAQAGKRRARFNFLFLRRFWLIMRVAVPSVCSKSLLLLVMLVVARAAEEYNYYQAGVLPSQFYSALASKDINSFKDILWKMAIIIVSVCVCKSGAEFAAGLVYVRWRACITRHMHRHYFSGINYYLLNTIDRRVDNPDQRITQDVDRFCDQTSKVLPKIILQPFLIAYYTYRTYEGLGWYGVLGIYLFFLISTVINKFLMGPIASLIFQQERQEGNFRFHHVQVRANSESVAFYQGGKLEAQTANQNLRVLLRTQLSSVHWQFPLNFSVFMFDYVSTVISYSLIGIAVFSGKYDSLTPAKVASAISINAFFSLYLLNGFSTVVDTAVTFAEIAGYTHRVGELLEVFRSLDEAQKEKEKAEERLAQEEDERERSGSPEGSGSPPPVPDNDVAPINTVRRRRPVPPNCVEVAAVMTDLTIAPPDDDNPLIQGLNLEFRKGKNVLILGETGTGKSSILRVLRRLWPPLEGEFQLCSDESHHYFMFLPQKAFLTSGCLANQVTYPERPKTGGDEAISYRGHFLCEDRTNSALQMAGLLHLRERLGGVNTVVEENWYDIVSPGESQRMAFSRLFFHKPPFAMLDEATSALSEETEHYFYTTLHQLGITVMSVGHRSTLKKYHHQILTLRGDQSWQLTTNNVDLT